VIDRRELAETLREPLRLDGGRTADITPWRDDDGLMAGAFRLRQEVDERVVERVCVALRPQFLG
jgi:hypothetical protein